ncbi:MAG: prepilin-type N-terminal cleavage/methylation domain-containing protein [Pirellulales bacterium]|nr:prepilin-type N-terminal cleavage/methylation domain-containing protein [Pirellulales bacterium]
MIALATQRRVVRRGTTLIEMVVSIAIISAIFGVAATLFGFLLTGRGDGRRTLEQQIVEGRLVEQFRRDVHEATHAEAFDQEGSPRLKLTQADERTVEYRYEQGELARRETQAGKPVRLENYGLPRESAVRFALEPSGDRTLVRLEWTEESASRGMPSAGTSAAQRHEVIALVGRNIVAPIRAAANASEPSEPMGEAP